MKKQPSPLIKGSYEKDIFEAASKASTPAERLAFLRRLYASVHAREHPEVDKFLFDKKYLGFEKSEIRPNIRKVLNLVLMTPDVQKAYILLGKGSGKSWLACIAMAYKLHELLSYVEPARYFGLSNDTPIGIVNMAPGAAQALNVIFNFFSRLVDRIKSFENIQKKKFLDLGNGKELPYSPYKASSPEDEEQEFNKEKYRQAAAKLFFPEKNIMMVSGHSRAEAFYGYSLFTGLTDETDFLDKKKSPKGRVNEVEDQTTQGEEIIQGLEAAGFSRFKGKELMIHISTTKAETGNLTRRVIMNQTFGKEISLDDGTVILIPEKERPEDRIKCHRHGREISIQGATWLFTGDTRATFIPDERNLKNVRDYGCIPPSSAFPATPDQEIFAKNCNYERLSPLTEDQRAFLEWFKPEPGASYYIHCDLALSKDNAAIAMAHRDNQTGKYIVDFIMEIITGSGSDKLSFQRVHLIILSIKEKGFRIAKVTIDGWQSEEFIENLISKNIYAEHLSVDTSRAPYETLIGLIFNKMLDYYNHPTFLKEMKYLEDRGDKFDHAHKFPDGTLASKDTADATAGAVYNVVMSQKAILLDGSAIVKATSGVVNLNGTMIKIVAGVETEVPACYLQESLLKFNIQIPSLKNRSAYINMTNDGNIILIIGYRNDYDTFIVDMVEFYESEDKITNSEDESQSNVNAENLEVIITLLINLNVKVVSLGNTVPYSIIEALRDNRIAFLNRDIMAKSDKAKAKHVHTITSVTLDIIVTMCNMITGGELKFCNDDRLMRDLYELGETNYKTKHFAKGLAAWTYYNIQSGKTTDVGEMPQAISLQNHLSHAPQINVSRIKPKVGQQKPVVGMPGPVRINRH